MKNTKVFFKHFWAINYTFASQTNFIRTKGIYQLIDLTNEFTAGLFHLSNTINTSDLADRSSIKQQPLKIATDTASLTATCVTVNDPFSNQGSIKNFEILKN